GGFLRVVEGRGGAGPPLARAAPALRGRGPCTLQRGEGPDGGGAAQRIAGRAVRPQRRPLPLRLSASRGGAARRRQPPAFRFRGHGLARGGGGERGPPPPRGGALQPRRRGR